MNKRGLFVKENHYCPNCCNHFLYSNSNCIYRQVLPAGIICEECGWEGNTQELLTKEEYMNKNRTKLIERMLYE